jgi:hypothetical protein
MKIKKEESMNDPMNETSNPETSPALILKLSDGRTLTVTDRRSEGQFHRYLEESMRSVTLETPDGEETVFLNQVVSYSYRIPLPETPPETPPENPALLTRLRRRIALWRGSHTE